MTKPESLEEFEDINYEDLLVGFKTTYEAQWEEYVYSIWKEVNDD